MASFGGSSTLEVFLRLRDEASAGVRSFGRELREVSGVSRLTAGEFRTLGTTLGLVGGGLVALTVLAARAADRHNQLGQRVQVLQSNLSALAQTVGTAVLPIILAFLDAMNAVLSLVNQLPDPLIKVGGGLALIGGGLLTIVGAAAIFISVLKEINAILKINIVLQSILKALQGPIGVAHVVGAIAVGAAVGVGVSSIVGGSFGSFQRGTDGVPGPPGQPRLVIAHGGESIGSGGGDTFNFSGPFLGTRREAKLFADFITANQKGRTRSTTDRGAGVV